LNNFGKNLALFLIIAFLLVAVFNLFQSSTNHGAQPPMAYSDFAAEVEKGQVKQVLINGRQLAGVLTDGRSFNTIEPGDPTLVQHLLAAKVNVKVLSEDENPPSLLNIAVSWFPLLAILGIMYFFQRRGLRLQMAAIEALGGLDTKRRLDQLEAQLQTLTSQVAALQSSLPAPSGQEQKGPVT
jgi:ATP-dependent Zn protease